MFDSYFRGSLVIQVYKYTATSYCKKNVCGEQAVKRVEFHEAAAIMQFIFVYKKRACVKKKKRESFQNDKILSSFNFVWLSHFKPFQKGKKSWCKCSLCQKLNVLHFA